MPKVKSKEKEVEVARDHDIMPRANSPQNPIILNSATFLNQPNGLPFNAQLVLNINQAKILIKIIERLQEPIRQTISNKYYRENPLQLSLFLEEAEKETIQLDFELSEFGVSPANYNKLKQDFVSLQNFSVVQDTIYYNKLIKEEIEGSEYKSLINSVIIPKKYERYVSIKIDKDVVQALVNVKDNGFTRYLLEISMSSSSKYASLMYQHISSWRDKEGFSWTLDTLRKKLGIVGKYENWNDLNARVLRPAYEELFEKADLWFEYKPEKKNRVPYKVNFKVVKGYFKVLTSNDVLTPLNIDSDIYYTVDESTLTEKAKAAINILKTQFLINDINIIGEIVSERLNDFYIWFEANRKKFDKIENPAAGLLYFLNMTTKQGWNSRKWKFIDTTTKEPPSKTVDHSLVWNQIYNELSKLLPQNTLETWFSHISIDEIIEETDKKDVKLNCPSPFFIEQIETKHIDPLFQAVVKVLGEKTQISYRVNP